MSVPNSDHDLMNPKPFAQGKNVRINLEGLAICTFDKNEANPSFVHFLQFVEHHQLRFSVVRIAPNGDVTEIKEVTPIPQNIPFMSIRGSRAQPIESYKHTPDTGLGEKDLDLLLHLSKLHGSRFSLINPFPSEITTLTMENTAFYTSESTREEYSVKLNDIEIKKSTLCRIIGGYIQCNSGTINIDIPGIYTRNLNIVENGVHYKYEISFSNHCIEERELCEAVIGSAGADVNFSYFMLQPDATPIMLEKIIATGALSDVAACLPVQVEPFN